VQVTQVWIRTSLLALAVFACAGESPVRIWELPVHELSYCAVEIRGRVPALDVAIAIDGSRSTRYPSGVDIDGNGRVGAFENSVMTDPADSLLAAQVTAVRSLLRNVDWRDARFSIVVFYGRLEQPAIEQPGIVVADQAVIAAPLTHVTTDLPALESALDRVLARGSFGTTQFSAGMRRALVTLTDSPPSAAEPRRAVLLISDSPHPAMIAASEERSLRGDPLMKVAARKAIHEGIRFHTFGLAKAATAPTPHSLSRIAGATGGTFRPVPDPENLHCYLLRALVD
jgi:hypothetical protein